MGKKLIQQRRGRTKGRYSAPTHRFKGKIKYNKENIEGTGIVEDIIHDPGRTTPISKVRFNDKKLLFLAAEGIKVGDSIEYAKNKNEIKIGNILTLSEIDEGLPIYNIEISPGDGGKLVRSSGNHATVVSHQSGKTVIRLPSGQFKTLQSKCRATIGILAGGGRKDKPFLKAGKKYHAYRTRGKQYPVVRGVAMNAVSHPHGGGGHQHVGKPYTVKRGASPGRKVGSIAASRTGRK
jgi:large subunit ribosomal protein L2